MTLDITTKNINDTQHNKTQHYAKLHNDTKHYDAQQNAT